MDADQKPMKGKAFWFAEGMRKVTVLGSALLIAELTGVVAFFNGFMSPPEFIDFAVSILQWGSGIFVVGNALEHGAKVLEK